MPNMIAFHCNTPLDFLEYAIHNHTAPTTIVVCSSREAFLEHVHSSIRGPTDNGTSDPTEAGSIRRRHPLLIPTIHLLARSRTIDLVFTPTLQHLRAYLATMFAASTDTHRSAASSNPNFHSPMLAVLGLLDVHRETSEYTAQGLSRSLSIAVDTSIASERRLVLAEILPATKDEEAMAVEENEDQMRLDPWMEQIPILNGSIRSRGDERVWAGRTVEVARVLGRWCRIVKLDDDLND